MAELLEYLDHPEQTRSHEGLLPVLSTAAVQKAMAHITRYTPHANSLRDYLKHYVEAVDHFNKPNIEFNAHYQTDYEKGAGSASTWQALRKARDAKLGEMCSSELVQRIRRLEAGSTYGSMETFRSLGLVAGFRSDLEFTLLPVLWSTVPGARHFEGSCEPGPSTNEHGGEM